MELTAIFQEIPKYTITALSSDETLGTVTGGGTYYRDTEITLTATAKKNCYFDKWSDGETNATRKITVQSDMELTAIFQEIPKYTITALSSDENLGTVTGGGTYYRDTEITLTATAKTGGKFIEWSDGNKNPTRTIIVTEDLTLIAYYDTLSLSGHAYVDLGLPSGTLWATCNVGATNPEDYGDYFAWGETSTKSTYNWSTYKYCNGSYDSLTKYCTSSSSRTVDNKTVLEASDDAARVHWGGVWRMPTKAEQQELLNECTWSWTTLNGVEGYRIKGKNANSIFLPAAGERNDTSLNDAGSYGDYWSSSLHEVYPYRVHFLFFSSTSHNCTYFSSSYRYFGKSVRPVCSSR